MEWAKLAVTLATSVLTVASALYIWWRNHKKDRELEQARLSALYVNPYLLACHELQSRLYNILERGGIPVIKSRYPDGSSGDKGAEEHGDFEQDTLYLIAQYFGWENVIFRYGPYTKDGEVIKRTEAVRDTFASSRFGVGAFTFFRPEQRTLAQVIMRRISTESGYEFEAMPIHEFKQTLEKPPLSEMPCVQDTLEALMNAKNVEQLEGRSRLIEVQNNLVALLNYIEAHEKFSLFPEKRKLASQLKKEDSDGNSRQR